MNPFMDIFNADPFSVASMTEGVQRVPYMPTQIGNMGLFSVKRSRTEVIGVETQGGTINLIKTTPRGAPLPQQKRDAPRIAKGDRIMASELAFVRQFNTEGQIKSLVGEMYDRMSGPTGLVADVNYTWEHMRLGGIMGKVLDADGSTIVDWYDKFGISVPNWIYFDFANTTDGALREKVQAQVVRVMEKKAQGARYSGIGGLCGDTAWDDLHKNSEFRATYLNQQQASELRGDYNDEVVSFGGVEFERYRGSDDGAVKIADDEIRFFPKGTGNTVFEVAFAPGETFADVGSEGKPLYAMTIPDRDRDQYVDLEVYSYPAFICKRPEMLLRGKAGAA